MQSGNHQSQGGAFSHFQRGSNNSVHSPLATGLPQNTLTIQYPPGLGVAHGPAQRQQGNTLGNTQSLQNFQGHQYPFQSLVTAPSSSERTNANVELLLNKRQSQQVRSLPAAPNFGQTSIQGLDNFGGTLYTSLPQQFSSVSPSGPPSTDGVLPVRGMLPPSDEDILNCIAERLEYYRAILRQEKSRTASAFHPAECFSSDVITEGTAANGQVPEETSSKASQTNAETDTTSASEKCSAENLQIVLTTATICVRNEDGGPSMVPETTLDGVAEKPSSLTFNCSSLQEVKTPLLNTSKTLEDIPSVSRVIKHTKSVKGGADLRPVEALGLGNVRGVRDVSKNFQNGSCSLDSENRTFELPSYIQQQAAEEQKTQNIEGQKDCVVTSSEVHLPSNGSVQICEEAIVSVNQSKRLSDQISCDGAREDVAGVSPKTCLPINKEPASLSESNGEETFTLAFLKDPQYEDISDDDASQPGTNEELVFPARFEEPQYDDISECGDSETDGADLEKLSLTQIPELSNKPAPFENEGSGNVQGQTQMEREITSSEELSLKLVLPRTETLETTQHGPSSSLCFTETDDGFKDLFHPKCDSERHLELQTNPTRSCSPASVLADEEEADDLMDEGDWFVLPLSISDLKFEAEDENHNRSDKVVPDDAESEDEDDLCETSFMPLEEEEEIKEIPVFDTIGSYLRSQVEGKASLVSYCNFAEQQTVSEDKLHALHNRNESYSVPEDSSGTEDSCDYSSGSEHNYLTVSRKLVHRPSEVNGSVSEEDNKVANVRECQTASSDNFEHLSLKTNNGHLKHNHKTNKQKISKVNDVIILDSDTDESDDESDHKWKKNAKEKRFLSSSSGGSGNDMISGHSPATADSRVKFPKSGSPFSDSTEPQCQSKPCDERHKKVTQDTRSDATERRGAPGFSSQKESIIILDSDTDDDSDLHCKKAKRKRLLSSGSKDGGDAPHVQKRQPSETANEKLKETKLSSAVTSLPQKQPKPKDTQFKKVSQGSRSDQSQDGKKKLGEAKGSCLHVQHKNERQTMSKENLVVRDSDKELKKHSFSKHQANRQSKLSSEGTCNGFPAPKPRPSTTAVDCGTAKENPKKLKPSSEHSTKKQPRFKTKKEGSHVIPDPVVAHLAVCMDMEGDKSQGMKTPSKRTQSFQTKNKVQAIFRPFSLHRQSSPSSSISSSSSTSRHLSEAKQRPVTSSLLKSQQSTSIPRKPLPGSELRRSHSNSSTSTLDHTSTPTKRPSSAIMITPRRHEITKRRRRSLGIEGSSTSNLDSLREARTPLFDDSTPRRRHSAHKPVPPLMKKTTKSAIELTKARIRDVPKEQSYPVGEGYKWSEKSTVSKPAKGPSWDSELEGETSTHRYRPYW